MKRKVKYVFFVNNAKTNKKVSICITLLDNETHYVLLRNLAKSLKSDEISYEHIIKTLRNNLESKPILVYKLKERQQSLTKTILENVLKKIIINCEFESNSEDILLDQ